MIKINFEKINKTTSLGLLRESAVISYLQNKIEFLATHNKNYNKKQYETILEMQEIINNITIKGE